MIPMGGCGHTRGLPLHCREAAKMAFAQGRNAKPAKKWLSSKDKTLNRQKNGFQQVLKAIFMRETVFC